MKGAGVSRADIVLIEIKMFADIRVKGSLRSYINNIANFPFLKIEDSAHDPFLSTRSVKVSYRVPYRGSTQAYLYEVKSVISFARATWILRSSSMWRHPAMISSSGIFL